MTARHTGVATPVPPPPDPTQPRRLLSGWTPTGHPADLGEHQARFGPVPTQQYAGRDGRERLLAAVDASGLRGRGGAGFHTGRKLRATGSGRGRAPVVVANGCESEPVSDKDRALLTFAPHLVLDGAVLAAAATGATELVLCVHRDDAVVDTVAAALAARPAGEPPVRLVVVPGRYVSSEETALINFINTGDARPTAKPPLPFERGVRGRPTVVDNVETLAHLALIARYGAAWFRGCGTSDSPGSTLVTVSGCVARPGVYEVAIGIPVSGLLDAAGGLSRPAQGVLFGGYGGGWLEFSVAARLNLTHADLAAAGATLGVGSLVVLPGAACGLTETARMLRYLAGESALQCGPCMFGLPAIAEDLTAVVVGGRAAGQARQRLQRRLTTIAGRGACAHPDGATRLAASALRCFHGDLRSHLSGSPCAWAAHPTLPLPPWSRRSGDWT